jgi:D-alanyl-D-alanine carboxypeptidase/D-alanyl-D-alanine-endopeptidase (penicillin-binding protein 4)
LGNGWSWDDYNEDYMAERSVFPVCGNLFSLAGSKNNIYSSPRIPAPFIVNTIGNDAGYLSKVTRSKDKNDFSMEFQGKKQDTFYIPFVTFNGETGKKMLADTLQIKIDSRDDFIPVTAGDPGIITFHSQATDSVLKIMMHRSDNFFAEQFLLMVSDQLLGVMTDDKIIDTLLKTDYRDMPQHPAWADGSGLSRYNLFSPQDFVFVLNKMRNEFNWNRITTIFATGGTGTLGSAYKGLAGKIYAKTGSLGNNAALSGYIITKRGKTLIFSILIGNHMSSGATIRNGMSQFLQSISNKY